MEKLTIAEAVRANARMLDHVRPSPAENADGAGPARPTNGDGCGDDAEAWALVALHRRQSTQHHWHADHAHAHAILGLFR
ncbi:MAG: hypothetical protein EA405_14710 [Rhodospirillales bacterium]|nr:MAG: hypothetical protein EA405_14710 [Rhodospirillales bacterium]